MPDIDTTTTAAPRPLPSDAAAGAKATAPDPTNRRVRLGALWCGVGFFGLAIVALAGTGWVLVASMLGANASSRSPDGVQALIWIAMLSALVGYILLRAARNPDAENTGNALPSDARELLRAWLQKSEDPIGDWTKLVGLTGGTGVFRKLELSGMPLATILMTLLFCVLGLIAPVLPKVLPGTAGADTFDAAAKIFLDMAKLTLGAFIGSFVTKSNARDAETSKAGAAAAAKLMADKLGDAPAHASKAGTPQASPGVSG